MNERPDDKNVRLAVDPEDQLRFQRCMATAFLYSYNGDDFKPRTEEELALQPSETWVSGTPMTSGYVSHDFDVWFDSHLTRATGIGGVSTMPEGRGQGGIRAIFEKQLPDSYEKGYVFSMLFPFSHVFYRKFGYELIQKSRSYRIPIASLKPFVDDAPIVPVFNGMDLKEIHDAFGRKNNLCISRKEKQWHQVSKDPAKDVKYTYKIGEEAFVCFKPVHGKEHERMTIRVTDLGYSSMQGLKSIFGFLYSLRAQFNDVSLMLPDSVPMMEMIPECYEVETEVSQHGMARVVNVKKALEMMTYPAREGSFTVKVTDEQIADNNTVFRVDFAGGSACVSTCAEAPDLTLSIQRLTQLMIGSLTLDEALWLNHVDCSCPEKFRDIFIHKDIYFDDPF